MKQKLNSEQHQEQTAGQQAESQAAKEFSNVEELLRYDAAHTTVPAAIAERLQKSAADVAPPNRSWWRRFFGGQ